MSDVGVWRCRHRIVVWEVLEGELVEALPEEEAYVGRTVAFRTASDPRRTIRMDAELFHRFFEKIEEKGGKG